MSRTAVCSLLVLPLVLAVGLFPQSAHAKDLRTRVGVGFDQQFGQLSAFSIRYGLPNENPAINIQLEGDFGFSQYKDLGDERIFGGGKLLYGVVVEDNLNLYLGAGGGFMGDGAASVVRIQPLSSVDFFLFGLENLGITTGIGLNIDVGDGGSGVAFTGAANAGVHYWF
jgi:hypothetical protein